MTENVFDLMARHKAEHAERMKSFPVEVAAILEKTSQGSPYILSSVLYQVKHLEEGVSDAVLFELRGQVHGHADAAWVRAEIDVTERDRLVAYANGFTI
ncbi:hypothetical protein DENIT_20144 [Pseudomonas veronii]|uniref:hypothetical protein n=1 Tax=Pseudomonas veronii TaxID=76761 RepID=UPI001775FDB0|nr:hypothetical protein [Pseudomonas veronii]CAD0264255.1 hypothetical protein DENIT_20144 [Pseudomonas veronii]